jgi:SAM-dependent methyltransferase
LDNRHRNIDSQTVDSFGDEWTRFDQTGLGAKEHVEIFDAYFSVFPWATLPQKAEGFDMGCGSGRWAKLAAPRVGKLHCIDASDAALAVARRNLAGVTNVTFTHASVDDHALPPASQDFGYSLGVLHHIPDTQAAIKSCVALLKPGAPFLVYLYYAFDNRPAWFHAIWKVSELLRRTISRMSPRPKAVVTDVLAALVYLPLARLSALLEALGLSSKSVPLSFYRDKSFYVMRTDCRDRFGTILEQRFSKKEITIMMTSAGLTDIKFAEGDIYWCAVGTCQ